MGTPERLGIVVAGAGIGGLTAAAALARRGRRVTVLERRGGLSEAGTAITLWPSALAALDVIGAGAAVRAAGAAVLSGGIRAPDGSWLQRLEGDRLRLALGEALLVVARAELLAVLASALDPAAVRFGAAVESWRPAAGGAVEVMLAGGEVVTAEGLVGADGAGSAVARQLQPGLSLSYAGYTAWRGVADLDVSGFTPSETWGPGGEFGYLPMAGRRAYWFATENTPEGGRAPGGEREYLHARLAGWHEPVGRLIGATAPEALLRHDIYDRSPLARWSDGPVVVIGDAAHPMRPHLGQGGCQAIEDGVVLAGAIGRGGSLPAGFSWFARARQRRVRRIVRESALIGRVIQGSGPVAAAARRSMKYTPAGVMTRHLAGIGGSAARSGS